MNEIKTRSNQQMLFINANPERLWAVLTQPKFTKQYMFNCAVESDWQLGSTITWRGNYQGYEAFQKGEIIEIEPYRRLKYSTFDLNFGLADVPENYIHVTYQLYETAEGTALTIVNETFDGDAARMQHIVQGWGMVVDQLKTVAEQSGEN